MNKVYNRIESIVGNVITALIDKVLRDVLCLVRNEIDIHMSENRGIFLTGIVVAKNHHHLSGYALHRRTDRRLTNTEGFLDITFGGNVRRASLRKIQLDRTDLAAKLILDSHLKCLTRTRELLVTENVGGCDAKALAHIGSVGKSDTL